MSEEGDIEYDHFRHLYFNADEEVIIVMIQDLLSELQRRYDQTKIHKGLRKTV